MKIREIILSGSIWGILAADALAARGGPPTNGVIDVPEIDVSAGFAAIAMVFAIAAIINAKMKR